MADIDYQVAHGIACTENSQLRNKIADLRAENERLRGEVESWKALVKDYERKLLK